AAARRLLHRGSEVPPADVARHQKRKRPEPMGAPAYVLQRLVARGRYARWSMRFSGRFGWRWWLRSGRRNGTLFAADLAAGRKIEAQATSRASHTCSRDR